MSKDAAIDSLEHRRGNPSWRYRSAPAIRYALAAGFVAATVLLTGWLKEYFQGTPNALFFCAIIFSTWFGGLGPGAVASVLSILAIKFYFTPPFHSLAFKIGEIPRFTVFLIAGGFISWLGDRQRRDEAALTRARDELETKVDARTLALTEANARLEGEMAERARAERERRRVEETLKTTEAELDRVALVTTMGELTASIAHEVNQPLAAVVTNGNASLRWLAATPPNFDEACEALRRIVRDGTRAGEVIARIRGLLQKGQPTARPLDLNDLIREIAALTHSEMGRRRASLEMDLAGDLPAVTGDRVRLQQVLLNLVMNALDAMCEVSDRPRLIRIRTGAAERQSVLIAVEDSGIGLDPQEAPRLFDAFYSTKADGLGMGLSISRSIVQAHGGRLWASANEGPGATFQFTLPIVERDCL